MGGTSPVEGGIDIRENYQVDFLFEKYRDNPDRERQVQIALDMWDAGAHLLTCNSDPTSDRFKVPTNAAWQTNRNTRAEIENWVRAGRFIGIMAPSRSLGISCVDIDNGVEYRTKAIETLGTPPLVAHESSRTKPGKCHFWYHTPNSVSASKWAGGDIRSDSNHQVLLYNLDAVGTAWDIARAGNATPVDLSLLEGVSGKSRILDQDAFLIETDSEGVVLDEDVVRTDAAVPTEHRHDTMIAKIGRAVMQSSTKTELNKRVVVITNAHKESLEDEDDHARKASIKNEIANARVFAEGAWAKKIASRKIETEMWALVKVSESKDYVWSAIAEDVREFARQCTANSWPNPHKAIEEMQALLDRMWRNKETRQEQAEAVLRRKQEAAELANAQAQEAQRIGSQFKYQVQSDWGTKWSWVEASEKLGIKFRFNTFKENGDVWIPESIMPKRYGGGTWQPISDQLKAAISMAIERHATAPASSGKKITYKPVEVNRHKEGTAISYLFSENQWCPMRDYFESLPPWCGEHIIHNSMERGGMKVDAGPFTGAAQAFLWLFIVRNCLYPGSSMREYIVLHGENDCGKSKFVELALPPHLKEYWNGGFSLDGTLKVKLERSIGKAVLECGEMGQGGAKDWNAVKQWLTLSEVSGERLAYKEFAKRHKLTATTVFTTNHPELPPTDDAVLSRFIWVKVLTPATRAKDEAGNELNLVWQHFNQLYDPSRPELGTWRDQYFAQALAIVRGSVSTIEYVENGEKQVRAECNVQWLPPGSKSQLVDWNKQAGSTYTTDQSNLVDELEVAIKMLGEHFQYDDLVGFYPNRELDSARAAVVDQGDFIQWSDLERNSSMGDPGSVASSRMRTLREGPSKKAVANALRLVCNRLGMECKPQVAKWDGKIARGWMLRKIDV